MIKKIFMGFTMVSALVACTDDYTDWKAPQQNAKPETVTFGDGSVAPVGNIDFAAIEATADSVAVCEISAPTASNAAFSTPSYLLRVGDATFNIGTTGRVAVADLKSYVETTFGRKPVVREMTATVEQWISNGSTNIKVCTSAPFTIKATPDAPVIEKAYYLVGSINDWDDANQDYKLVNGGGDVYDDPVFTCTVPASVVTDNVKFKLFPQSMSGTGNWDKCITAGAEPGKIVYDNAGNDLSFPKSADPNVKSYVLTFDMLAMTYSVKSVSYGQFIYFIGATDGWSKAEQRLESPNFDGVYTGYVYCADPNGWGNQFKFRTVQDSWDGQINAGMFTTFNGDVVDGGDNFGVSGGENVYYFVVDLPQATITATEVKTMGIIGNFNGWGGDVVMTWNAADYCYEATNAGVGSDGWKFRVNNDWPINLGGNGNGENIADLCANGADLTVAGNTIKLYPTRKTSEKIFCTVE